MSTSIWTCTNDQGDLKHYTIECANPGILDRIGWKFNMIKVGDKITTIIAPLRTGEPGGLLKQVTLADGRKFENGAPGRQAEHPVGGIHDQHHPHRRCDAGSRGRITDVGLAAAQAARPAKRR